MCRSKALVLVLIACLALGACRADAIERSSNKAPAIPSDTPFAPCPDGRRPPSGPDIANTLPPLTLGCLDGSGTRYSIASVTGKPLVINVWASWCAPCRTELPAFQDLHQRSHGELIVLGVVTEDVAAKAIALGEELGVTFPNVFDATGELRRKMGRNALPLTLFVSAAGELRYVYQSRPLDSASLRTLVAEHLN